MARQARVIGAPFGGAGLTGRTQIDIFAAARRWVGGTCPMNYNRRSTRPDAGYYRETRKIAGAARSRGGGGAKGFHPLVMLVLLLLAVAVAWWAFRG